jgi:hypothetical protein
MFRSSLPKDEVWLNTEYASGGRGVVGSEEPVSWKVFKFYISEMQRSIFELQERLGVLEGMIKE